MNLGREIVEKRGKRTLVFCQKCGTLSKAPDKNSSDSDKDHPTNLRYIYPHDPHVFLSQFTSPYDSSSDKHSKQKNTDT
jgi:hypothetical protein